MFTGGPIQGQAMRADGLDVGAVDPGAPRLPASSRAEIVAIDDVAFSDRLILGPASARWRSCGARRSRCRTYEGALFSSA